MEIRLNAIVNDSIVDGRGIRLTVFTQGCTHNCSGCHNPQTHDLSGGYITTTDKIIAMVKENPLLDGITLSGGEPFLQSEPCAALAREVHMLGLDVWAYTGFLWEDLIKDPEALNLLNEIDVLIDGRFILEERSLELLFCGSKNQRIIDVQASLKANNIILWK